MKQKQKNGEQKNGRRVNLDTYDDAFFALLFLLCFGAYYSGFSSRWKGGEGGGWRGEDEGLL